MGLFNEMVKFGSNNSTQDQKERKEKEKIDKDTYDGIKQLVMEGQKVENKDIKKKKKLSIKI
jgi:hypothetical protein